ncbi:MAG: bifunctional proline dehydrogenase/L-glutamate gamma-semialdehyde dehydrogenase PutA [Gammaproteobacteria bacterium]|nr:bifunctional proline dehydrogenase/L-glutamate gamma-semialdehyde dehydrogenase PutA [Gammaproteobacteria bacterium]
MSNSLKMFLPSTAWNTEIFTPLTTAKDEPRLVADYHEHPALNTEDRKSVLQQARAVAKKARGRSSVISAEKIMATYKLSSAEGRMILELAEALLRIPDNTTRDLLIFDKLAPGHWLDGDAKGFLRGMESALELASSIVRRKHTDGLQKIVSRLGVPTVRMAIEAAMRQMGGQFVFAEHIEKAVRKIDDEQTLFSFDMLGEAARSEVDCDRYFAAYQDAINKVGPAARDPDVNRNSGVSIKLSALSCRLATRYWMNSRHDLIQKVCALAINAHRYNIPVTIDAEEFARLRPTLDVFESVLNHPDLRGWNGLGMVIQAYARHANSLIDRLEALAQDHQIRISVRLVKGAYWDTEIKVAQEKGLSDFPVYTAKHHTDLAYLALAKRLMTASRFFHPQFASHNAYTLCAVHALAKAIRPESCEVQKLHGMGDAVHEALGQIWDVPLRVYAPVGRHRDLLAYLVRRVIENGASSSFMNQLADSSITIDTLVSDPFTVSEDANRPLATGDRLFLPHRLNSGGFDVDDPQTLHTFTRAVAETTLLPKPPDAHGQQISEAFDAAQETSWKQRPAAERAEVLDQIAVAFERSAHTFYQLIVHEAGKTVADAAGELREATDFCRYYAAQIRGFDAACRARGTVVAISPWNFPLAIFTGQIVAALGAGNAVLAKPAEQTPRIAALAVSLMHRAGVPTDALHLIFGGGENVGAHLAGAGRADMIVFTGSNTTAKAIESAIAHSAKPHAPLIAETGGLNAMMVDSSALLERVVDDVLASAFQSAGQRCSALRILYMQEDIADDLVRMVCDAATALKVGAPQDLDTDIGPVIDAEAKSQIDAYVALARAEGRLIWRGSAPSEGFFCAPAVIEVKGINDLEKEIFGPVLHVARYSTGDEACVIEDINRSGYGLTFGLHSRLDSATERIAQAINVGNVYINRNQIGAVVGSQPFGGHGLSGTGPKAGGPAYLRAFLRETSFSAESPSLLSSLSALPGPTGESNHYILQPRGKVFVFHPDPNTRKALTQIATTWGNHVEASDALPDNADDIDAWMTRLNDDQVLATLPRLRTLSEKRVIPLVIDSGSYAWLQTEKHICRNTTASGGNIDLLMQ